MTDRISNGSGSPSFPLDSRLIKLFVKWPNIEVRDEKAHTDANETRHRNGVLSRQGWAEDDEIDWPVEKVRTEQERQEDVEFTAPPPIE